jgi:hypothetical protein
LPSGPGARYHFIILSWDCSVTGRRRGIPDGIFYALLPQQSILAECQNLKDADAPATSQHQLPFEAERILADRTANARPHQIRGDAKALVTMGTPRFSHHDETPIERERQEIAFPKGSHVLPVAALLRSVGNANQRRRERQKGDEQFKCHDTCLSEKNAEKKKRRIDAVATVAIIRTPEGQALARR